jgi:hypothetical protein
LVYPFLSVPLLVKIALKQGVFAYDCKWVHAEAWRTAGVDIDIEIEDRGCGLSLEGRKWSLS